MSECERERERKYYGRDAENLENGDKKFKMIAESEKMLISKSGRVQERERGI